MEISVDVEVANCQEMRRLRNVAMCRLESWAIDTVSIEENSSDMPSERFAQRLTLMPIRHKEPAESIIKFDFVGPRSVMSGDILPSDMLVYDDMIVCRLGPGECIRGTFDIAKGTGRDHVKWSHVSFFTWKRIDDDHFRMNLRSTGEETAEELMKRALCFFHQDKNELRDTDNRTSNSVRADRNTDPTGDARVVCADGH